MNQYDLDTNYIQIDGDGFQFPKQFIVQEKSQGIYTFSISPTSDLVQSEFTYEVGKKYTVTLKAGLSDIYRNGMQTNYVFSFIPEPYFRAVNFYPFLYGYSSLYIEFNSKIDSSIFSHVSISPTIGGRWIIYFNRVLIFQPTDYFMPNTKYTVTVNASAQDSYGHKATRDYVYYLEMPLLDVSFHSPFTSLFSYLDTPLKFKFNYPIDSNSVPSAFQIIPHTDGKFIYTRSGFDFQPSSTLQNDSLYTIVVDSSLRTNDKKYTLGKIRSFEVRTPEFWISESFPQGKNISRYTPVEVRMNNTIDTSTIRSSFTITPDVPGTFEIKYKTKSFVFKPAVTLFPNTEYCISIKNTIQSLYGRNMRHDQSWYFKTGE